jgi:hypothetical protein
MIYYHSTTPDAALQIIANGFRDAGGPGIRMGLIGVWISECPLDFNEGAKGDVLLRLQSEVQLSRYEVVEEGKPFREWCVPARLLNRRFTCRVADWGFISLGRAGLKRSTAMRLVAKARAKKTRRGKGRVMEDHQIRFRAAVRALGGLDLLTSFATQDADEAPQGVRLPARGLHDFKLSGKAKIPA